MKKRVLALTALSSLLLSAGSLAAPSAEIKVIGELVAPSCEVTMPDNGVIDYGEIIALTAPGKVAAHHRHC